jgi:hypothetical protein
MGCLRIFSAESENLISLGGFLSCKTVFDFLGFCLRVLCNTRTNSDGSDKLLIDWLTLRIKLDLKLGQNLLDRILDCMGLTVFVDSNGLAKQTFIARFWLPVWITYLTTG